MPILLVISWFEIPSEKMPTTDVVGGVLSNFVWSFIFGWLGYRTLKRKLVGLNIMVLVLHGFMNCIAIVILLAIKTSKGTIGYLGGTFTSTVLILHGLLWSVSLFINTTARVRLSASDRRN